MIDANKFNEDNGMTDQPEKLGLASHNIAEEKQQELLRLFPEIRTEGGKIDFERLKLVLGETVDVGKERYGMSWPGKADCFKTIQQPSLGTLRPCPEKSVNFDTAEHIIIEGDNLEVLKLLQKSYLGKVKMIYIDPPYNTGKDFIYPDNYTESLQTYLEYTEQVDNQGKKFGTNTDTDGRFHSKWLNMMYPRLFLAKNLLSEDGVIFINIGEEEFANLQKVMNEIFGEENCLSLIARVAKTASNKGTFFAPSIDFILCYSRNNLALEAFSQNVDETLYKKIETSGPKNGEKYRDDIALYQSSLDPMRGCSNQRYYIQAPDGTLLLPPGNNFPPDKIDACNISPETKDDKVWRWSYHTYLERKHLLVFKQTTRSPLITPDGKQASYNIYTKSYLKEREEKGTLPRNYFDNFINRKGADLIKKYGIDFSYSKPVELIEFLISICSLNENDIICDFFAGSFTTAHAVIRTNIKQQKQLRFIMIQLPEVNEDEEQKKQGLKNIFDIGAERIRRVIKEVNEQNPLLSSTAFGFKAFRLSSSNFKVWDSDTPKDVEILEKQLELHVDHVRDDRTPDDLLYEILIKSGFPLTAKVENIELAGKTAFSVAAGAFLICLERELTLELIQAMAAMQPERIVCLDMGFAGNDQLKANAVQLFKDKDITSFKTI